MGGKIATRHIARKALLGLAGKVFKVCLIFWMVKELM
jgi:hypothetical protein